MSESIGNQNLNECDRKHDINFEAFLELHAPQLQASGVPVKYWPVLATKVKEEILDAGNSFIILQDESSCKTKVVVKRTDGISVDDPNHIYVVDHAWTYKVDEAHLHLETIPGLLERMCALMDIETEDQDKEVLKENVLYRMWKYNQTYSFGNFIRGTEEALPIWYILDEFGSRINHSDEPSFRAVPFFYLPLQIAFTLIWPIKNLEEGDEVTRDYVESSGTDVEKRRTRLIPWMPVDMKDIDYSQTEPEKAFWEVFLKTETTPNLESDFQELPRDRPLKVYVEYVHFRNTLTDNKFELVDSELEADILSYFDHYKEFRELSEKSPGKLVNQFPMECLITTKDLLAIISRRAGPKCSGPGCIEWGPNWLPETFDLQTELPKFVSYYQHREERGLGNLWICKPWNMARSLDTHITNNLDCIIRIRDTGPKVACKYVEDPVLFYREGVGNVKFDVRPFSLDHFEDYEKHFTVMNYKEGVTLKHINCEEFVPMFEKQYPDVTWSELEKTFFKMFKEIFEAATSKPPPFGLQHSPQSRSMYAIDFLLKWERDENGVKFMQPVLCEVNFSADCERACKYHPRFANDIFNIMFLDDVEGRPVLKL